MDVACTVTWANGTAERVALRVRLDTQSEVDYYCHGGIFQYVLRRLIEGDRA
jgi:aconitate hydratase